MTTRERDTILIGDPLERAGFTQVHNVFMRCPGVGASEKLLYMLLKSHAWEQGSCFPGVKTLAAYMGVQERRVQVYLARLEQHGFIIRRRRGRGLTNIYYLPPLAEVPVIAAQLHPPSLDPDPASPRGGVSATIGATAPAGGARESAQDAGVVTTATAGHARGPGAVSAQDVSKTTGLRCVENDSSQDVSFSTPKEYAVLQDPDGKDPYDAAHGTRARAHEHADVSVHARTHTREDELLASVALDVLKVLELRFIRPEERTGLLAALAEMPNLDAGKSIRDFYRFEHRTDSFGQVVPGRRWTSHRRLEYAIENMRRHNRMREFQLNPEPVAAYQPPPARPAPPPPPEPEPSLDCALCTAREPAAIELWEDIYGTLTVGMAPGHIAWVDAICPVRLEGTTLVVRIHDETARAWVLARLSPRLNSACAHAGGYTWTLDGEQDVRASVLS